MPEHDAEAAIDESRPVTSAAPTTEVPGDPTTPSSPLILNGLKDLRRRLGTDLGTSRWRTVTQAEINGFADLTGDHQWIHVDPQRAANGPFGTTVQHGFMTLGVSTGFLWEVCEVAGFDVILNYGLNKVRFPAPLKCGSSYRMNVVLAELKELDSPSGPGAEVVYRLTYEVDGAAKPCCVADLVFRYYP